MDDVVEKIRPFNRFYMPSMNLPGNHYLGSEYSVPEARVFYEIYANEGSSAARIAREMNIDKSYLCRIIKRHEQDGFIRREKSSADSRIYLLFLTDAGKKLAEDFIRKSNEEVAAALETLSEREKRLLADAIDTIIGILSKGMRKNENSSL